MVFENGHASSVVQTQGGVIPMVTNHIAKLDCETKPKKCILDFHELQAPRARGERIWISQQKQSTLGILKTNIFSQSQILDFDFVNKVSETYDIKIDMPLRTHNHTSKYNWNFRGYFDLAANELSVDDENLKNSFQTILEKYQSSVKYISENQKFENLGSEIFIYQNTDDTYAVKAISFETFDDRVYNLKRNSWYTPKYYWATDNDAIVTKTDEMDSVLVGINRFIMLDDVERPNYLHNIPLYDRLFLKPIIDKYSNTVVGVFSPKSIYSNKNTTLSKANESIRESIRNYPYVTLENIQYSSNNGSLLIKYFNWETNQPLFSFLRVTDGVLYEAYQTKSKYLQKCFVGYALQLTQDDANSLSVELETIGSASWPTRVLKITSESSKGAVVFLRGGPRGTLLDKTLINRVYQPYLKKGYDIYAFEYSGMTSFDSKIDTRLMDYHELALQHDVQAIDAYLKNISLAPDQRVFLHSESFGSILALALLNQNPGYFDHSIFISPLTHYKNPREWFKGNLKYRLDFEKKMLGLNDRQSSNFLNWMGQVRNDTRTLKDVSVILGENDVRLPVSKIERFFSVRGAEAIILENANHQQIFLSKRTEEKINEIID